MNDLFVAPEARSRGVAEGLIAACLERCREHGATRLVWQASTPRPERISGRWSLAAPLAAQEG
jgi:GNAT superfamily N-acetyltransferase